MHIIADSERSSSESISIFEEMENRLSSLERKLRTVEQPGKSLIIRIFGGHTKTYLVLLKFGRLA